MSFKGELETAFFFNRELHVGFVGGSGVGKIHTTANLVDQSSGTGDISIFIQNFGFELNKVGQTKQNEVLRAGTGDVAVLVDEGESDLRPIRVRPFS